MLGHYARSPLCVQVAEKKTPLREIEWEKEETKVSSAHKEQKYPEWLKNAGQLMKRGEYERQLLGPGSWRPEALLSLVNVCTYLTSSPFRGHVPPALALQNFHLHSTSAWNLKLHGFNSKSPDYSNRRTEQSEERGF